MIWSGLVRAARAEEKAQRVRRDADRHPDQDEEDDGKVGIESH